MSCVKACRPEVIICANPRALDRLLFPVTTYSHSLTTANEATEAITALPTKVKPSASANLAAELLKLTGGPVAVA